MLNHRFDPTTLREYDIRGRIGETLSEDDAHAIGRSFGTRVRRAGGSRVAVGYDGRHSSPAFEAALVAGLNASGCDALRIGLGPTPMLYFAVHELGADGGVMITGSHNPPDYNGFKMMLGHGPFFGDDIRAMGEMAAAGDWETGAGSSEAIDIADRYVDRLLEGFDGPALKVVWDTGNGAAGPIVEKLTARLPGTHHLLFTTVDGDFPNHHPDPTEEKNLVDLKRVVAEHGCDLGLGFDGDGDRLGAIDGEGRVVWGDQLLGILAGPVLAQQPGATIIADVKSSQALFDRIAERGGVGEMYRTGHSLIKKRMKDIGAPLAGEMSGHIFFAQGYYGFDDGLYAAIRLIATIGIEGQSLAALRDSYPALVNTPELRFPVSEARKFDVVTEVLARLAAEGANVNGVDGARVTTPDGWWLLRASNTQDVLVARAEAADQPALDRLIAAIDAQLAASGVEREVIAAVQHTPPCGEARHSPDAAMQQNSLPDVDASYGDAPVPANQHLSKETTMATNYEFDKSGDAAQNAMHDAAASAQQGMHQAADQVRAQGEDAMRQGQAAMGQMADKARETMDKGMKAFDEFNVSARGGVEAWTASSRIAAQGVEQMVQQAAEFSRKTFEDATSVMRTLATARTPGDVFAAQNEFAKKQFDNFVGEFSRLTETMMRVTNEVFEPLQSKMTETAQKAGDALKSGFDSTKR